MSGLLEGSLLIAELVIGSPEWIVPAIIIGTLLTFLVLWNYARSGGYRIGGAWVGVTLKLMAIALLAACLLQPMRRAERPRPRANLLPIVVDTSDSMELKVGRSTESWRDRIERDFAADSSLFASMSQSFETRLYGFNKRLASAGEIGDLGRGGTGSRLIENITELSERLNDRPVAGILLMSDGNVPAGTFDEDRLLELPIPIYPVLPSQASGLNDLRIAGVSVRQSNFEISPVTVSAQLAVDGSFSGSLNVRLKDVVDNTVIEQQTIALQPGDDSYNVTFQFRPRDVGLRFYRLDAFRPTDVAAFDDPDALIETASSETTLVNNTRMIAVDRRSGPYRVLYVAGRPNWEFKFLRRAVSEDAEVELTGLLRMANKEPKFSFRDKGVSDTNPLFQGLGDDAEETAEQYDEPVLIRIGVKESEELASGFPKTEDELFQFDAMILDDLEPEFFSQDQLEMVRRFVSARGGGLLLLGGQEMFRGSGFADSFLGDLSPVYVRRGESSEPQRFRVQLTREGMLQPWLRLRENVSAEGKRIKAMPDFTSANVVGSLKPGAFSMATLLAEDGKRYPAVAVQRFGKGKVGAVTIADLWRWAMNPDPENPDDSAQAWRQMTRWLVGDVPRRTEIVATESQQRDGSVLLRVEALDASFLPLDNPDVVITVERPEQDPITLTATPDPDRPGMFTARYFGDTPGEYVATAEVRAKDGELVGTPKTGWTRQIAGREFDAIGVNRPLLERIASASGGRVVEESNLDSFAGRLNAEKVPVTETWVYPLWHRGWVIALALGCLCGEWTFRRIRGLP